MSSWKVKTVLHSLFIIRSISYNNWDTVWTQFIFEEVDGWQGDKKKTDPKSARIKLMIDISKRKAYDEDAQMNEWMNEWNNRK